jgi:hypothetical protein
MSGLARLLARHVPAGIYRWSSPQSIEAIRHVVEHAHWRCLTLDTWKTEHKADFLESCAEAFGFPESFGHNFDALDDCLSDVRAGSEQEGVVVVWDGWGPFARADRVAFDVAVDVFGSRVDFGHSRVNSRQSSPDTGGDFTMLLHGPGPDVEIPLLDPPSRH